MVVNLPWVLGEETMEGMASVWGYHESVEDLKHKLLCATMELESVRTSAKEELRRSEESINQLILLLKITSQERDEARDHLQILLNDITQSSPAGIYPLMSCLPQPDDSPQAKPLRGNSSITELDSLSETHNHHSYVSSPVESFFDTVSSPDLSNMNMADSCNRGLPQQTLFAECNNSGSPGIPLSDSPKYDRASAIIERIVTKKTLPEKGSLLKAVMDSGPLLQNLLVAGPLPRWRNPPPLQPFHIPPVSVKGNNSIQKMNQSDTLSTAFELHQENLYGGPQICAASMLSFSGGDGLSMKKRSALPLCASSYQSLSAKRQKSQ